MNDGDSTRELHPRGNSDTDRELALLRARVEAQAQELDGLRRALASSLAHGRSLQRLLSTRQRELEQLRSTVTVATTTLREQLERVAASSAWRYGHAATRTLASAVGRRPVTAGGVAAAIGQADRLLAIIGAAPAVGPPSHAGSPAPAAAPGLVAPPRVPTRGDELLLGAQIRDRLGPAPDVAGGPSVSAVIVSRSAERAGALLRHLDQTSAGPAEVILVDNCSPGGEVSSLAHGAGELTIRTVRADAPVNFSEACNRGAREAAGELLLFVNDDIRPAEPGWLAELVATVRDGGAGIAGATLVNPTLGSAEVLGTGWTLEQRGIALGSARGEPGPIRRERDTDVPAGRFGTDVPAVAVSGACLLVAAATFAQLGGFDTGYQYGLEDIDLCLRARAHGHLVACSGRSVVIHGQSMSQSEAGREFRRLNRAVNRRRLRRLWGVQLRRERLRGVLAGDPAWGAGAHLAIARTSNDPAGGWGDHHTAAELGAAAQALGWRVTYLGERDADPVPIPDDLDLAVVLTDGWDVSGFPASTLLCAWIRNWTERWLSRPWLDRYDVLLASSSDSARRLTEATGRPVELFALATNPRRFVPAGVDSRPTLDWVLTANRWGEPRTIEPALARRRREQGAIYGRGWSAVRALRGLARPALPYDALPDVYRSARVVLDDTAEPTLAYGAVNARVFDALACGVPVLTNCVAGVRELFDDEFPTWSSPQECTQQLQRLLEDPDRGTRLAQRYRRVVLAHHTYEHRIRHLRRIALEHNERLSFCLKVGAPDAAAAERWGDLHFARALGRALRRAGHRWRIELLPDWDSSEGSSFDVTIHLLGRSPYAPAPGQFNVLWLISHPESFDEAAAEGYDLVCVASAPFAAGLRSRLGVPVHVLEQATDPRVFFPDPDPELAHELAFVGNSRGVRRKILDDLLPTDHDLAVWGGGWSDTPAAPLVRAEHVANEELRRIYSSAGVVLCDHWPDMRAQGFRSNRIYDALACGALVLSDDVLGLAGSLGDAVLTYREPGELRAVLDRLLADPQERARRVAMARARVIDGETFDHRAERLLSLVGAGLDLDPVAEPISPPPPSPAPPAPA